MPPFHCKKLLWPPANHAVALLVSHNQPNIHSDTPLPLMNIKAFAEQTGVSAHTLRYYEKIGLLQVQRNQSGHRVFSDKDLEWITFILRLKDTGMPLQHIIEYAEFRAQGDSTMAERQQLLQQHRDILQARIARELEHLQVLDNKIGYYRQLTGKV